TAVLCLFAGRLPWPQLVGGGEPARGSAADGAAPRSNAGGGAADVRPQPTARLRAGSGIRDRAGKQAGRTHPVAGRGAACFRPVPVERLVGTGYPTLGV